MTTSNSNGTAENPSVSAGQKLDARESLLLLATEAEEAADSILTKIAGMEATRKTKMAEAKEYRAEAKKLEN